jgi:hypothetical protein
MLIVHSFPAKDPLDYFKDGHSKPDNYIRVSRRLGGDHHVFPFASGSLVEATWALEESRRIFAELGGSLKGVVRTIWKPNPAVEGSDPSKRRTEPLHRGSPRTSER